MCGLLGALWSRRPGRWQAKSGSGEPSDNWCQGRLEAPSEASWGPLTADVPGVTWDRATRSARGKFRRAMRGWRGVWEPSGAGGPTGQRNLRSVSPYLWSVKRKFHELQTRGARARLGRGEPLVPLELPEALASFHISLSPLLSLRCLEIRLCEERGPPSDVASRKRGPPSDLSDGPKTANHDGS